MAKAMTQKPPDAACPMCGSALKNSPAGKAHLQMLQTVGTRMAAGAMGATGNTSGRGAMGGGVARPARMGMRPMAPSPGRGY